MMKKLTAVLLLTAMTAGLAACGSNKGADTNTDTPAQNESTEEAVTTETSGAAQNADIQGTITLAAAASLEKSFTEHLIPMFEEANPGVTVKGTYDSSGKLQTQIEEGLEADVFMSAAKKQMTALDEEGMIASDTITDLLENKIVLIVPTGNEKKLEKFEDIENADSIALGDPASVPAGQYAQEALTNLGIWDKIQDKVSFGTNVTEVLNQVAAASADAGIVYATDAASMADQVEVVAEAPEGSLAKKVIYPVAVVKGTAHEEVAKEFVAFLQTDKAITVFEEYGFSSAQ